MLSDMIPYGKSADISRTIKNVGSQATSPAMAKAESTAIGKTLDSTRSSATFTSMDGTTTRARSAIRGGIHPGSSAGLVNHKSVHLAVNDSGYLNSAHQTARHTRKRLPDSNVLTTRRSDIIRNMSKTFDFRRPTGGSISRLMKIIK